MFHDQLFIGDFIGKTQTFFYLYNNKLYGSEVLLLGTNGSIESDLRLIQKYTFSHFIKSSYFQGDIIYFVNSENELFSLDFSVYESMSGNPFQYSEIDPNYLIRTYLIKNSDVVDNIIGVYQVGQHTGIIFSSLLKRFNKYWTLFIF